MDGPPVEEATHQVEQLILVVEDLRRRVEALEHPSASAKLPVAPKWELTPAAVESGASEISSGLLAAIGRVLLGIAGAYLLRAVTEASLVPKLIGTLAGVLYACAWLVPWRTSKDNRWAATLHGLTASAILAPLLWEATIRFHTVAPSAAAAVLAIFIVLGQILAWRRDLSPLAGIVALAGSATALALMVATLDPLPFSASLGVVAAVVEYGACRGRVLGMRWIVALAADLLCVLSGLSAYPAARASRGLRADSLGRGVCDSMGAGCGLPGEHHLPHIGARARCAVVRDRAVSDRRRARDREHTEVAAWNGRRALHRRRLSRGCRGLLCRIWQSASTPAPSQLPRLRHVRASAGFGRKPAADVGFAACHAVVGPGADSDLVRRAARQKYAARTCGSLSGRGGRCIGPDELVACDFGVGPDGNFHRAHLPADFAVAR